MKPDTNSGLQPDRARPPTRRQGHRPRARARAADRRAERGEAGREVEGGGGVDVLGRAA